MLSAYRKILDLLTRRERREFYRLIALTLVMGLIDVLGVASILPFLAVLANPELLETNRYLVALGDLFGTRDRADLQMIIGIMVFMIVVIGLAARALTTYLLSRFVATRVPSLCKQLLERYLSQPYSWFLQQHSSDLGKSLLNEVAQVVNGPINAAIRLLAQSVIVVFILALLLAIDPLAAILIGTLVGGSYGLISFLSGKTLERMGNSRYEANRERFKIAQEALGGVKDVKMLNLEQSYIDRFIAPSLRVARAQARMAIVSEMPRIVLEGIVFGGMMLFLLWTLAQNQGSLSAVLPGIGAFAFAAARLFPAMQEVFRSASRLRFDRKVLDEIHAELKYGSALVDFAPSTEPQIRFRESLELKDVTYAFDGADRAALNQLSMRIDALTTIGIVGATGAGKSTAVDVILGLLEPQSGTLLADGKEIEFAEKRRWRNAMGYVPQTIFLTDDTVAANIAFGREKEDIDMDAVLRAAKMADLDTFLSGLPEGYRTEIGERGVRMSGGQRQRIGIARALYRDPDILVFDEATSALDNVTEQTVMDAIRALGGRKTIVMVAHRLTTVRNCDQIFLLEKGQVVAKGRYDALVEDNAAFRQMHLAGGTAAE
ncbi:ABC transporter ATP-binding protein [Palleronia rufa]|uniref:ABC transporter ATP-binding protein n=1 Tax=Palleronia rufa TaxID=1530186 RepID=UPI00055B90D1|nr:ABC transporter ATP-binding protein [Palleronia rufa]